MDIFSGEIGVLFRFHLTAKLMMEMATALLVNLDMFSIMENVSVYAPSPISSPLSLFASNMISIRTAADAKMDILFIKEDVTDGNLLIPIARSGSFLIPLVYAAEKDTIFPITNVFLFLINTPAQK